MSHPHATSPLAAPIRALLTQAPASAAIMMLMESMPVVGTNEPEDETGYVVSELLEVGVR